MSKYFVGLVLAGVSIVAVAPGCGDGGSSNSTSSGTGGSGGSTTVSSSSGNASSSSSGGTGDMNTSCDMAEPLPEELLVGATLDPIEGDEDFYTFQGTAGDLFALFTDAKPDTDEFDTSYPDLVITLFKNNNGKWEQIAQNDDPTPRYSNDSELYTVIGETGTYCLRVSECNAVFPAGCAPIEEITTYDYSVAGFPIDPSLASSIFTETEPNDNPPGSPIGYGKNAQGNYYQSLGFGTFTNASDLDVYSFTVPTDFPVSEGRPICYFDFFPTGIEGNGSTAESEVFAYITSEADPGNAIAHIEVTKTDPKTGSLPSIGVPCTYGTKYLLWIERSNTVAAGVNDFYVLTHSGGGSNPLEAETPANPNSNDTGAKAEVLKAYDNMDGSYSYYIDGDLLPVGADRDTFAIDVPAGVDMATVSVACGAQRLGSGLRGFRASLLDQNEVPIGLAISTESDINDVQLTDIAIPFGQTRFYLKLESPTHAPDVSSSFYRCGVHLIPPIPL